MIIITHDIYFTHVQYNTYDHYIHCNHNLIKLFIIVKCAIRELQGNFMSNISHVLLFVVFFQGKKALVASHT